MINGVFIKRSVQDVLEHKSFEEKWNKVLESAGCLATKGSKASFFL